MSESPSLLERFQGCILGHAVGDALAQPLEGCPAQVIYETFGPVRNIYDAPFVDVLTYTDDTQMTIGVAEALIADGRITPDLTTLAQRFVANFDPARGYGGTAVRLLARMAAGEDWRTLARTMLPGGSFGNGAAMRAAPVGLAFHRDLGEVLEQAYLSALPTHTHPLGVEGAQMIALAVAFVLREAPAEVPFDKAAFYDLLIQFSTSEEFGEALRRAARLGPDDVVGVLGNGVEAHRSVPTALACFAAHPDSYKDAVCRAIAQGGDCDTIGAMAGAISGARLGIEAVSANLLERLENGAKGRDYLFELARKLHERFA